MIHSLLPPAFMKHIDSLLTLMSIPFITLGVTALKRGSQSKKEDLSDPKGHTKKALSPLQHRHPKNELEERGKAYLYHLEDAWRSCDWKEVEGLAKALLECWQNNRQVFLCGNGGSAASATHLANDLLYGIDKPKGHGLRATSLAANASVLTCLGNDTSYKEIFSRQLEVLGQAGDLLIVISGSGNSDNIVEALKAARQLGLQSYALVGYSGGAALSLADHSIHFHVHDMQIAEDLHMMLGHMLSQWLLDHKNDAHPSA